MYLVLLKLKLKLSLTQSESSKVLSEALCQDWGYVNLLPCWGIPISQAVEWRNFGRIIICMGKLNYPEKILSEYHRAHKTNTTALGVAPWIRNESLVSNSQRCSTSKLLKDKMNLYIFSLPTWIIVYKHIYLLQIPNLYKITLGKIFNNFSVYQTCIHKR